MQNNCLSPRTKILPVEMANEACTDSSHRLMLRTRKSSPAATTVVAPSVLQK